MLSADLRAGRQASRGWRGAAVLKGGIGEIKRLLQKRDCDDVGAFGSM